MTQSTSGRVSRGQRGRIMLIGLGRVAKRNAFDLAMLDDLSAGRAQRLDQRLQGVAKPRRQGGGPAA